MARGKSKPPSRPTPPEDAARPAMMRKSELLRKICLAVVLLFFFLIPVFLIGPFFFQLPLNTPGSPSPEQRKQMASEKLQTDFKKLAAAILKYEEEKKSPFPAVDPALLVPAYLPEIPKDPWGTPYDLAQAAESKGGLLRSPGSDRLTGNADDLIFPFREARLARAVIEGGRLVISLSLPTADLLFSARDLAIDPPGLVDRIQPAPVEISPDRKTWTFGLTDGPPFPATATLALRGLKTSLGHYFASVTVPILTP